MLTATCRCTSRSLPVLALGSSRYCTMPRACGSGCGDGDRVALRSPPQVAATNPMEIVKIRMQMQALEGTNTRYTRL